MGKKYQLMRRARGRTTVEDSGDRSRMHDRLKQLRNSTRHGVCGQGHKKYKAEYWVEEAP